MFNKVVPLLLCLLFSNIKGDIVGEYRLTGLNIVDYDFCRQNTEIVVTEKSGFDTSPITVYTIPQGEKLDHDIRENYPLAALNAAGVDLYVYFAEDGTATVLEGSTYPTEVAGEGCLTEEQTLPITEDFTYALNLNSNAFIPMYDIIGIESRSPYKGMPSGSISITGSSVFDNIPIEPTDVSIPFPIDTSSVFNNNNGVIPADTILPEGTAGYAIYSTEMYSFIDYLGIDPSGNVYNENNPPNRPSLYIEWHAIDGDVNQSGFGDITGEDEDGDGTDFDSIRGLEFIKITKVLSNDECGVNSYDIAGNHIDDLRTVQYNKCLNNGNDESTCIQTADDWINSCIDFDDTEDEGNSLYVMDLSQDPNFNWGGYITWNSIRFNYTGDASYLADDSNENFNSSCLDDGDDSDCSGRILYEYTPQCIPTFNIRYFMAELEQQCQDVDKDECGVCFGNGIPVGYCDCYFKYRDCSASCDENISNDDLSCFGCDDVAYSELEFDVCGICGGDGTTCLDCNGVPNGNAVVDCNGTCNGNSIIDCKGTCNGSAILDDCGVCDGPGTEGVCDCDGNWPEEYCDCDGNGPIEYCYDFDSDGIGNQTIKADYCPSEVPSSLWTLDCSSLNNQNIIHEIGISKTYPNPFNPSLNIEFSVPNISPVNILIYNINGQLVKELINEIYMPGNYNIIWNAEESPSGVYLIEFKSKDYTSTNRVELIK